MTDHTSRAGHAHTAAPVHTWETHNCITTDTGIRHVSPDAVDDVSIACCCVPTRHLPQDVVIAALKWDVEKFAQLGELSTRFDQSLGEVTWVAGRKANTLNP